MCVIICIYHYIYIDISSWWPRQYSSLLISSYLTPVQKCSFLKPTRLLQSSQHQDLSGSRNFFQQIIRKIWQLITANRSPIVPCPAELAHHYGELCEPTSPGTSNLHELILENNARPYSPIAYSPVSFVEQEQMMFAFSCDGRNPWNLAKYWSGGEHGIKHAAFWLHAWVVLRKGAKDRNGPPWAVAKEFGVMSSGCSWSTLWNSPGIGPRCFQRAWLYTILLGHGDQFQGRRHTTENHSRLCRCCVLLILCFTEYPAARVAKIYNKGLNMERSAWSFLLLHFLLDSCTYRIHQNTKQSCERTVLSPKATWREFKQSDAMVPMVHSQ